MKKTVYAIFIMVLLLLSACGEKKIETPPTIPTQAPNAPTAAPTQATEFVETTKPTFAGEDVFGGAHFDEMLWGYYEASSYDYTGDSAKDTAAFRKNMQFKKVATKYGQQELSVLPLDIQMGSYSQFMDVFSYGGKSYSPYTEKGTAMFRKAYMEKYGDLNEEGFQKIEKLLQMNVAKMTFAKSDGGTQYSTFAYEIRDDAIVFYGMSVDEKYNVTIGDVYARYYFLHDGGKLTLECNGVRREYLANGYKAADEGRLQVAGYAQDRTKQYENLEGFALSALPDGVSFQIQMMLSDNARPVDASVIFDKATGDFSVTWTKSEHYSGVIAHNVPQEIRGKLIPCTNYDFDGYSGFYLIVDGICYSYLVCEDTYKERRYANIENGDKISDLQREEIADVKVKMLAELEQAFKSAEIPVTIDYSRGQIALESTHLFDTNSYEISLDGQAYLQRFMDAYLSVVTKEDYAGYVSRILIEGHTNTAGQYAANQSLSMHRADAVAKTCAEHNSDLKIEIQFTGCAYDYPVYKDDGSVDMEKSNRMVFRTLLTTH